MTERVLVVPTSVLHEAGLFQGFTDRVGHYLPRLLRSGRLSFMGRQEAEEDPNFKQLIPYVVFRHAGLVFHYLRAGGGEKRLHARQSVGIGGHISADDGSADESAYHTGMRRELQEEVETAAISNEQVIGLINDDRTPVGKVHLGFVHVLDLEAAEVRIRESSLVAGGFALPAELRARQDRFETWSQLLLEGYWLEKR